MFLDEKQFESAFEALSGKADLYVPCRKEQIIKFGRWEKGSVCDFLSRSDLPPKDILFPQTESLYSFKKRAGETEISGTAPPKPAIIFGIRPCDIASVARMDDVFTTKDYLDTNYKQRRDNTVLAALVCERANPACFCDSMGVDPNSAKGADVEMCKTSGGLNMTALTEKGVELLKDIEPYLSDSKSLSGEKTECTLKCDTSGVSEKLSKMHDDEIWTEIGRKCLGCGVCTYVCPTCYCFDINQECSGREGTAFRCWDSCMFSEYTRMAGGENPRPSKRERVRNRFLHKLLYFDERYGKSLCVGCGRCLEKCPAAVDIVEIIEIAGGRERG